MSKGVIGTLVVMSLVMVCGCGGNTKISGLAQFYALNDNGNGTTSHALDVANDGTTAGYIQEGTVNKPAQWFNNGSGVRGRDDTTFTNGEVVAISSDGSASLWNSNGTWFYWPKVGSTTKIGDVASNLHSANGLSADGSTVIISKFVRANASSPITKLQVYKWRSNGIETFVTDWHKAELGVTALGRIHNTGTIFGTDQFRSQKFTPAPGPGFETFDGVDGQLSKVVGQSSNGRHFAGSAGNKALVWLDFSTSPTDLGFITGDTTAKATGISDDGKVVVGQSGNRAFYWTAESGMRDLRTVLLGNGMDVRKWTLNIATAVSPNGEWIIGDGVDHLGKARSFLARIKRT